jgi:hypothetical protein
MTYEAKLAAARYESRPQQGSVMSPEVPGGGEGAPLHAGHVRILRAFTQRG